MPQRSRSHVGSPMGLTTLLPFLPLESLPRPHSREFQMPHLRSRAGSPMKLTTLTLYNLVVNGIR